MGTYGLDGVIRAWECERLTPEQAIGQLLQLVAALHERVTDLERDCNEQRRNGNDSSCGCQSGAKEKEKGSDG